MKKIITTIAIFVLTLVFSNDIDAQKFPKLDKSPADIAFFPSRGPGAKKVIKVQYGRPQLKGRSMSKLAPAGKVWRTGANEAAQITFYKDVTFGGKAVKAGTYSLFTIPGEKEWTVIINKATNDWGAFSYSKDKDVARVKAKVTNPEKELEAFSIVFDKSMTMHMGWGNTVVSVPVK